MSLQPAAAHYDAYPCPAGDNKHNAVVLHDAKVVPCGGAGSAGTTGTPTAGLCSILCVQWRSWLAGSWRRGAIYSSWGAQGQKRPAMASSFVWLSRVVLPAKLSVQVLVVSNDQYGEGAKFLRSVMLTLSPRPKDVVVSEFNAMFPESRRDPACWDYSAMASMGVFLKVCLGHACMRVRFAVGAVGPAAIFRGGERSCARRVVEVAGVRVYVHVVKGQLCASSTPNTAPPR